MQVSKGRLSGSVAFATHNKRKARKTPIYKLRYRLPSGKQSDRTLGKAWIDLDLWREKGEVKHLRSQPKPGFLTRQQADAAGQAWLDAHADSVPEDRKTFGRAVEDYITYCVEEKQLRDTTLNEYRGIARRCCERPWRDKTWRERPLDSFTEEDLAAVREELRAAGKNPHTINQIRSVVRGAFGDRRVIQAWKWVKEVKEESEGKIRYFTPDEMERLLAHARDDRDRAVMVLGAQGGLRMSEIRGLRINALLFDKGRVLIQDGYTDKGGFSTTKGKKGRSVPMTDDIRKYVWPLISNRPRHDNNGEPSLVFSEQSGGPLDYWGFRKRFIRAIKAANLHTITPHELRHTFGTEMVQLMDIPKLQWHMGHKHTSTTMIYIHFREDDELSEAMSAHWRRGNNVVPLRQAN